MPVRISAMQNNPAGLAGLFDILSAVAPVSSLA
jgi:hypothetical protein